VFKTVTKHTNRFSLYLQISDNSVNPLYTSYIRRLPTAVHMTFCTTLASIQRWLACHIIHLYTHLYNRTFTLNYSLRLMMTQLCRNM